MRIVLYWAFSSYDTPRSEIYTLSLHDALPISDLPGSENPNGVAGFDQSLCNGKRRLHFPCLLHRSVPGDRHGEIRDRKSTRLNSSHVSISYAVFCLKKKTSILLRTR